MNCDCPCQAHQSQSIPTITLLTAMPSSGIPQQVVVLPSLLTTKVGARLSLFCDVIRQKGCNNWVCNVLDIGFRVRFRE